MLSQTIRQPQETKLARLSQKDITLLKNTYRRLSESFYQNPKQAHVDPLSCLLDIIVDVIANEEQARGLSISSTLQILKAKSRQNELLNNKTQEVIKSITHISDPKYQIARKQKIRNGKSIMDGLKYAPQSPQLFTLSCTLILRLLGQMDKIPLEETVGLVGTHSTVDTKISVEVMLYIRHEKGEYILKNIIKTGTTKHLMKNYIPQMLQNQQKLHLYRGLKLLKLLSSIDKNFLKERQKTFAQVLYVHEQYIPIVKEMLANCYEQEYSQTIFNGCGNPNLDWIDRVYVWSHDQDFSKKMVQSAPASIKKIEELLKLENLSQSTQTKVYAILSNLAKYGKTFPYAPIPPRTQRALKNCLKLVVSFSEQQLKMHKGIDSKKLQAMVASSNDPLVPKLFSQFMQISDNKKSMAKTLDSSLFDIYAEKNAQVLIQKASHIPIKKEDLEQLIQILGRKYPKNEFEADCLHKAKQLAIDSLTECVLLNKTTILTPQMLNKILRSLHLSDVEEVSRLIQLLEIYMLKNPDSIDDIELKTIQQIFQWLEDQSMKNKGLIDWGACAQVINILFGENQWAKEDNFNDALDGTSKHNHKRTFWLLNLPSKPQQNEIKRIMQKVSQINPNHPKLPLILGFLARSGSQLRTLILCKNDNNLIPELFKEPVSPNVLLMLGFLVDKWEKQDQMVTKQKITKEVIPSIFKMMEKYPKFDNSTQACKLLTQCLPMQPQFDYPYSGIPVQILTNRHGLLSEKLYRSKKIKMNQGNVYENLKQLVSQPKQRICFENISEVLVFLNESEENNNPTISCAKEPINSSLQSLLDIIVGLDKDYSYWKLYPNYVNIMTKFMKLIVTLHRKQKMTKELMRVFQKNYDFNSTNKELNQDEFQQIIQETLLSLSQILKNCKENRNLVIPININKFRDITNRVKENQPGLTDKIFNVLNQLQKQQKEKQEDIAKVKLEAANKIKLEVANKVKLEESNKTKLEVADKAKIEEVNKSKPKEGSRAIQKQKQTKIETQTDPTPYQDKTKTNMSNKADRITSAETKPSVNLKPKQDHIKDTLGTSIPKISEDTSDRLVSTSDLNEHDFEVSNTQPSKHMVVQTPKQIYNLEQDGSTFQNLGTEVIHNDEDIMHIPADQLKLYTQQDLSVIQAIKKLELINEDKQTISLLPKILAIFTSNTILVKYRDILGHTLARTYFIRQQPQILQLLLQKEKTTLSKNPCYELLNKFFQTFVLSKRYKLLGREWIVLAMERVHQGHIADGCLVTEYNLIKTSDIQFFQSKGYHKQLVKLHPSLSKQDQIAYYVLLLGTTCRLNDIRNFYLKNNMHMVSLRLITQGENSANQKILANGSYAISSMLYMQPSEALKMAKERQMIQKILKGIHDHLLNKGVVQSGCCLISNMTYNNEQVKLILQTYKMVPILLHVFQINANSENSHLNTFKHIIRAIGNCSVCKPCAIQIIDGGFSETAVKMVERFDVLVYLNEQKLKVLKLLVDLLANLTVHKHSIQKLHKAGVTQFVITLLETTQINEELINGCIDTIDGLCQVPDIQKYAVNDKNLPYILIDILKMQENQKMITKSTRLLTNLTINSQYIPAILKANLLSILGNIVMLSHFNKKLQTYVSKVIIRVYNSQQPLDLILKSGYLDCLVRVMEVSETIEDTHIDIMLFYSKSMPNFLNKRAFMCMIRVLSEKPTSKQLIEKSIKIFKNLLNMSIDRDEEDLVIAGSVSMYSQLLPKYPADVLYLLGSHCLRSHKLRQLLKRKENIKIVDLINSQQFLSNATFIYGNQAIMGIIKNMIPQVSFIIFNEPEPLVVNPTPSEQQTAYAILQKGIKCKLFRIDGSSKKAVVDLDQDYALRAYKFPDGEIKKKYNLPVRNIRDWHFNYNPKMEKQSKLLWKYSIFARQQGKGFFDDDIKIEHCITLMGGVQWGQFVSLNLQFESMEPKVIFIEALRILMKTFAC